jgi:hypothetical protein
MERSRMINLKEVTLDLEAGRQGLVGWLKW